MSDFTWLILGPKQPIMLLQRFEGINIMGLVLVTAIFILVTYTLYTRGKMQSDLEVMQEQVDDLADNVDDLLGGEVKTYVRAKQHDVTSVDEWVFEEDDLAEDESLQESDEPELKI